ncbi:MAG: sigma-70 family RNA polymerase sigma factor, partial [Candidatus Latescibacterota bacterium]
MDRATPDEVLVRAVLQGEPQRFAGLVERYRHAVYAAALARLPVREDAEDVAQQTFVQAFRQLGRLEEPARFGAWVRRIAQREALTVVRQRQRQQRAAVPPAAPVPQPDAQLGAAELSERLWHAVLALPGDQRDVLLLHYLDEREVGAIAALLRVRESTVRGRLARGRAKLRQTFDKAFEREVREAIQRHGPGRDLVRKVMAALPLAVWQRSDAQPVPRRAGGGAAGETDPCWPWPWARGWSPWSGWSWARSWHAGAGATRRRRSPDLWLQSVDASQDLPVLQTVVYLNSPSGLSAQGLDVQSADPTASNNGCRGAARRCYARAGRATERGRGAQVGAGMDSRLWV